LILTLGTAPALTTAFHLRRSVNAVGVLATGQVGLRRGIYHRC
jgi:hypothetical protein